MWILGGLVWVLENGGWVALSGWLEGHRGIGEVDLHLSNICILFEHA
ncbi:uncharacterized protein RSE6_06859 [Rhynchosporium secalis]|uniref:Uncharacterized protein n=1 Tax=Rhynchosporium secalis TaxID=38038 RepID=A0A1E1MBH1_RHYSE|nr:uncharacterized protein RSE6_06859 [Rhynchosporium secalis]